MAKAMTLALVLIPSVALADCGVFFRQKVVHHVPYAHVVQPFVLYQAGVGVEQDALAEKIAQRVEARLAAKLQAPQQQTASKASQVLSQHCARCHTGEKANGGLVFDGSPLAPEHITAALRAISTDAMPKGKPLPPEIKGQVMQALLDLEVIAGFTPKPVPLDPGKLE